MAANERKVPERNNLYISHAATRIATCLLTRSWDQSPPHVLSIGLKPSTPDAKNNDPT
jgi:hypothetical protein